MRQRNSDFAFTAAFFILTIAIAVAAKPLVMHLLERVMSFLVLVGG